MIYSTHPTLTCALIIIYALVLPTKKDIRMDIILIILCSVWLNISQISEYTLIISRCCYQDLCYASYQIHDFCPFFLDIHITTYENLHELDLKITNPSLLSPVTSPIFHNLQQHINYRYWICPTIAYYVLYYHIKGSTF